MSLVVLSSVRSASCRRHIFPSVSASSISSFLRFEKNVNSSPIYHRTLFRTASNKTDTTTASTSSTPSSQSPLPTKQSTSNKKRIRVGKRIRQGIGSFLSGVGFLSSSIVSLVSDDSRALEDRARKPIESLRKFLQTSGVESELAQSLNRHLAVNAALLGRIQNITMAFVPTKKRERLSPNFWEEANRYMRYATAVYGQAMIHAAEVDARGRLGISSKGFVTAKAISSHIGVPSQDIVWMDVDNYDGDAHHLRHFVAIDHENQKVVLSIRGTFSLQEIVVDVAGFSREFCGGEGHSEMATMAERVWDVAGPRVISLLKEHPEYELILTGHSLGAGTACLLNVMLQSNTQKLLPRSQKVRCFAYAAPPTFTPLTVIPKAVQTTTNFIHQNDAIPFLSVHSIRNLFSSLRAVQDYAYSGDHEMSRSERAKVALGFCAVPSPLLEAVRRVPSVKPKTGAPCLKIPAGKTIWLRERDDGEYEYDLYKPKTLRDGVRVHRDMLLDHFPPRYEHALDHLVK